jgi:hypothetical protein
MTAIQRTGSYYCNEFHIKSPDIVQLFIHNN